MNTHIDPQIERISKVSNIIRILTKVTMYILAFMFLLILLVPFLHVESANIIIDELTFPSGNLTTTIIFLVLIIAFIKLVIMEIGLYNLYKLFSLYKECQIFVADSVRRFKYLGYTMILWAFGDIITSGLKILIIAQLSIEEIEPAAYQLNVGRGAFIPTLFSGIIIILISWVMDEGRKIKEDSDLTI